MKTPLQQFIEAIKKRELNVVFSSKKGIYIEGDYQKYFEIEKQTIIDTHSEGIKFMAGNTQLNQPVSLEFYNKKYDNEK